MSRNRTLVCERSGVGPMPQDAGGSLLQKPAPLLLASRNLPPGHVREIGILAPRRLPHVLAGDALHNALEDRTAQMHRRFDAPDPRVSKRDHALLRLRIRLP